MPNFIKFRPVGAELFRERRLADGRTGGRTNRHDEADSRSHSSANAPRNHAEFYGQAKPSVRCSRTCVKTPSPVDNFRVISNTYHFVFKAACT